MEVIESIEVVKSIEPVEVVEPRIANETAVIEMVEPAKPINSSEVSITKT